MREGLVAATDAAFVSGIMSGAPVVTSSGSTAAAVLADLKAAAGEMTPHARARRYLLVAPETADHLDFLATTTGEPAFPDRMIGPVQVLVTDALGMDSPPSASK